MSIEQKNLAIQRSSCIITKQRGNSRIKLSPHFLHWSCLISTGHTANKSKLDLGDPKDFYCQANVDQGLVISGHCNQLARTIKYKLLVLAYSLRYQYVMGLYILQFIISEETYLQEGMVMILVRQHMCWLQIAVPIRSPSFCCKINMTLL